MKKFATLAILAIIVCKSQAGLVTYGFNFGPSGSPTGAATSTVGTPDPNFTIGSFALGNSFGTVVAPISAISVSSTYTGFSAANNIGNAYRTGALVTSTSGYLSLSVTNNTGVPQELTDFDFGTRSTNTGPANYSLRIGPSFSTDIVSGTITVSGNPWQFKNNVFSAFTIPVGVSELRLYGYGGTGTAASSTQNGRYDDIAVSFNITAIPEPSAYLFGALATMLGGGAAFGRRLFARS